MTSASRILPASRAAGLVLVSAAAVIAAAVFAPGLLRAVDAEPHAPDVALFAAQPWVIQLHVLAAVGAVALGGTILSLRKGDRRHRMMGWAWVVLMGATAGSSLFIVGINGDFWSFIHVMSGWVMVTLPLGIRAVRTGRIARHSKIMTGMFWGASIVAGGFAFLPGRLMWNLFFG